MVSPETYNSQSQLRAGIFCCKLALARFAARAEKPASIDSAVGLRELRDQTSDRHAIQEKAFEDLWLRVVWLIVDCCKDLGADAPVIMQPHEVWR